jgi:hypothetical protein
MHPEAMGQWIIDIIDDGLRQLDLADQGAPLVARAWADSLSTFGVPWPDWAKDAAYHAAMAGLTAQFGIMREILNLMRDCVARMGLPTVLRTEADALEAGIGATRVRIADECSSENLRGLTNDGWISDAAQNYLSAYEGQEDQIDELETAIAGMVRVLRDSAASQDAWYSSNLFNAIGGVVGIAGLVVAIIGGFATPVAWVGLAIGIVGLLLNVIGYFIGRGDSEARAAVLSEVLTSSALPAWPKPAFAL